MVNPPLWVLPVPEKTTLPGPVLVSRPPPFIGKVTLLPVEFTSQVCVWAMRSCADPPVKVNVPSALRLKATRKLLVAAPPVTVRAVPATM